MDIRFARTINRIQKCVLAELNKIAIIHLFLLGFEDELSNFTLTLTNPSTQADLLKIDIWKEKITLYKDAVTAIEGIAPTSVSWAKKNILGFSDEEIKLDIQQQRVERAVSGELGATAEVIKHTGLFDNIDKLYGSTSGATAPPPEGGGAPAGGLGGAPEPGPGAGGPPPEAAPEPAGLTPEGKKERGLNILLENDDDFFDFNRSSDSLLEIEKKLSNLLKD